MTNEEDVEKKKGSMIFSLVPYVSINCIRFTGMISAQSTPTNNEIQSIYFVGKGQGDCNIDTQPRRGGCNRWIKYDKCAPAVSTHSHPKVAAKEKGVAVLSADVSTLSHPKVAAIYRWGSEWIIKSFNTQPPEGGCQNGVYQSL